MFISSELYKAVLEGTKELCVLLIYFAAAYSSNDHSWIFSVLVNAALLGFPCRFLRSFFRDSITHVDSITQSWTLREQNEDNS